MPIVSDNKFPKVILTEVAEPASPAAGEKKIFVDEADGHVKAKDEGGVVVDLETAGGAGSDTSAVHDDVAGEISAVAAKTTPVVGDFLLIEDSAAADAKKSLTVGNLLKLERRMVVFAKEGTLATQTGAIRMPNELGVAMTIIEVILHVGTAPTGAAIIVDVNKGGTTIFTTQANRPQVAIGANVGNSTSIDVASWTDGEYLTFDIDQIGSTVEGSDLTVTVVFRRS